MSAMAAKDLNRFDAFRRVALLTALSVLSSVAVTYVATYLIMGVDPVRLIKVSDIWTFALSVSVGVPAVVCP